MADQAREPEVITISLNGAKNLRGSRGEALTAAIKVEFNGVTLGESSRVETSEGQDVNFNFSTTYACNFVDGLDELSNKPLIVTLIEILPKEKKQKEEKSIVLGQASVDMMSMLRENTTHSSMSVLIHPIPGSVIESLPPETPKLEVCVSLAVTRPLVSDKETNVMAITVESLYAPPDSWSPSQQQYTYSVTLPLPTSSPDEQESMVTFPNGILKSANEKEAFPRSKRWLNPGPNTQGNAVFIPDKLMPEATSNVEDYELEDGELRVLPESEWRLEAESSKNRVVWNTERRSFLQSSSVSKVQGQIATSRYWPFEIWRVQAPKEVKTKKEDEMQYSFHGIAYVNVAKLLYPGVTKIRGAFKVHPYNEAEFLEKTKRQSKMEGRPGSGRQSPSTGDGKKEGTAAKAEKSVAAMNKDGSNPPPGTQEKQKKEGGSKGKPGKDDEDGVDHEGQQYHEAGSYIVVEIEVIRPLVPKKDPSFLVQSVAQYIPPRQRFPTRTNGAEKAVQDFHSQVVSVVNLVLEQYRDLFADEIMNGNREQTAEGMKQRYQALIYELNTSGKYFAFREQLKYSVIKIVREKYLRTTNFESQSELQKFLSELYVYLVDEIHLGLAKVLTLEDQTPIPEALTDTDQLKHFARESEVNNDMKLADQFYLERIARNKKDPEFWFDYACFNLLIGNIPKSIECTKECVSTDQKHLKGLLLYGILMLLDERFQEAEIFLEAATNFYPNNVEAWTVLGLYYDAIGNDIGHEMAIEEAAKINLQNAYEEERQRELAAEQEAFEAEQTALASATTAALDATENDSAEKLESAEGDRLEGGEGDKSTTLVRPGTNDQLDLGAGGASAARVPSASQVPGSAAAKRSTVNSASKPSVLTPPNQNKGDSKGGKKKDISRNQTPAIGGKNDVTGAEGEGCVDEETLKKMAVTPVPSQSIFMITAQFLLDINALKLADRALSHELTSATQGGGGCSLDYHLSLARLNLQSGNLVAAEKAVQQAIAVDFKCGDAWSLDGHLHYLRGRLEEARVSYERVLSFSPPAPKMHVIYLRLASIYLSEKRFEDAECTYLLACRDSPSCLSWRGVGVACYRLGRLSEAEDALCEANILNNHDPEVWAYLSLVCLQTGRSYEAEQSYKYALKVGLEDGDLLTEIHGLQKELGFGDPSF